MKKLFLCNIFLLTVIAFLFSLGASGVAFAIPCSVGSVTPAGVSGCEDGPLGVKNDSASVLNTNSFFGINTWELAQKWDVPLSLTTATNIDFNITMTNPVSGTWSINPLAWTIFSDLTIVLKDGKQTPPPDGICWSAYLLTGGAISGTWDTGGIQDPDDGSWSIALSHITIYGNRNGGGETPIPEPTTIILFGIGLVGVAGICRKKIK